MVVWAKVVWGGSRVVDAPRKKSHFFFGGLGGLSLVFLKTLVWGHFLFRYPYENFQLFEYLEF